MCAYCRLYSSHSSLDTTLLFDNAIFKSPKDQIRLDGRRLRTSRLWRYQEIPSNVDGRVESNGQETSRQRKGPLPSPDCRTRPLFLEIVALNGAYLVDECPMKEERSMCIHLSFIFLLRSSPISTLPPGSLVSRRSLWWAATKDDQLYAILGGILSMYMVCTWFSTKYQGGTPQVSINCFVLLHMFRDLTKPFTCPSMVSFIILCNMIRCIYIYATMFRTESRTDLCMWLCDQHNRVNQKLGKTLFECNMKNLDERWRKSSSPKCKSDH